MHLSIPARGALAALLSLSFIGAASAHSLWLERQGDGLKLYFGEFEENLREASPGLLDRLSPQAKVAGTGDKALKVDKTAGFFAVAGAVGADDSVVAEDVRVSERRTAEKVTAYAVAPGRALRGRLQGTSARRTRSTSCRPASRAPSRCSTRASRWPRPSSS